MIFKNLGKWLGLGKTNHLTIESNAMKTIITFPLAKVLILVFMFGACETQSVTDHKDTSANEFEELEHVLNQIMVTAASEMRSKGADRDNMEEIFHKAYLEVLEDEAMSEVLEANTFTADPMRNKRTGPSKSQLIVEQSETPGQALEQIAAALNDEALDDHTIIDLISVRQVILFMQENGDLLGSGQTDSNLVLNLENDNDDEEEREERESWWDSWGRCVAGTTGGAGAGCIAGCKLTLVGCPAGCVVGAVSGALVGAAEYC